MSDTSGPVARINALTTNARNTWFVLLGVLVFVSITLMGVQHIDFYGVDRATDLPLVNVSVPTWLFFYAAPLLITAVYGYFHLYLIRLWDVLGAAPARVNGSPLGDAITPWLVTDVALKLRSLHRSPPCITPRAMEIPNAIWNTLFAWIAGPAILGWLWWASMPARDWKMTATAGICLMGSSLFGYASAAMMRRRMETADQTTHKVWNDSILTGFTLFGLAIFSLTLGRTAGEIGTLAPLDLSEGNLTQRPDNWLPCEFARKDALRDFSEREGLNLASHANWPEKKRSEFEAEWLRRRDAQMASIHPLDLRQADFRNANLKDSFGIRLKLPSFPWERAVLSLEIFEGTEYFDMKNCALRWANLNLGKMSLQEVELNGADLAGVDLSYSDLNKASLVAASLSDAILENADLSQTQMQGSDLTRANLIQANLRGAQLQGARLRLVNMQGANLSRFSQVALAVLDLKKLDQIRTLNQLSYLESVPVTRTLKGLSPQSNAANLSGADLHGADLSNAWLTGVQLNGTNLSLSIIAGTKRLSIVLAGANISGSINNGGALRFAILKGIETDDKTDWHNVFFDSSVTVPPEMRNRIGQPCLWDWIDRNPEPLSDEKFFGHWRGWLTLDPEWYDDDWRFIAPPEWRDVPPRDPPPGCKWQTGLPIIPTR